MAVSFKWIDASPSKFGGPSRHGFGGPKRIKHIIFGGIIDCISIIGIKIVDDCISMFFFIDSRTIANID